MNTTVTMTLDEVKKLPPLTEDEKVIIHKARATPTDDAPSQTQEQLKLFKPWYATHPNESDTYKVTVQKTAVQIRIDNDVLDALKAEGKGYQTRINAILRRAVFG